MNTINNFVSQELMNAIGWTLLHSLWQGALIALVLGISMIFLQKKTSQLRYNLSVTAMIMMLAVFISTFIYSYQRVINNATVVTDSSNSLIPSDHGITIIAAAQSQNILGIVVDYFNHHLPSIVLLWFLGIVVMSLRFLGGLAYLQRLRNHQVSSLSSDWQSRLNELSGILKIKRSVKLVESAMVQVPIVIGYLKPMILLPIGTVNGLSPQQVEAILTHELAHISRHDYLVNIIQSVLDVLFFYHPAVWWISNNIRTEREHCCDDIALELCGNSLNLAKALTNLEVMKKNNIKLSVAFTGNKNQLFNRVARMLGKPVSQPKIKEGFGAAIVLILFLIISTFNANANFENSTVVNDPLVEWYIGDTTPPVPPKPPVTPKVPKANEVVPPAAPKPAAFPKKLEVPQPPTEPKAPKFPQKKKLPTKVTPTAPTKVPTKSNNQVAKISESANGLPEIMEIFEFVSPNTLANINSSSDYFEQIAQNRTLEFALDNSFDNVAFDYKFPTIDTGIIDIKERLKDGDVIILEKDDKIIIIKSEENKENKVVIKGLKNGPTIFTSPDKLYNQSIVIVGPNNEPLKLHDERVRIESMDILAPKEAKKAYKKGIKAKKSKNTIIFESVTPGDMDNNLFFSDGNVGIGSSKWSMNSTSFDNIKKELIKDGLIKDADKLSIEIKNSEKIKINGKEVPDQLKKKYQKLLNN